MKKNRKKFIRAHSPQILKYYGWTGLCACVCEMAEPSILAGFAGAAVELCVVVHDAVLLNKEG